MAESTDNRLAQDVLKDIADEERVQILNCFQAKGKTASELFRKAGTRLIICPIVPIEIETGK